MLTGIDTLYIYILRLSAGDAERIFPCHSTHYIPSLCVFENQSLLSLTVELSSLCLSTNAGHSFYNHKRMQLSHTFMSELGALLVLGLHVATASPVEYSDGSLPLDARGNAQSSGGSTPCAGMTLVGYRTVKTKVRACYDPPPQLHVLGPSSKDLSYWDTCRRP